MFGTFCSILQKESHRIPGGRRRGGAFIHGVGRRGVAGPGEGRRAGVAGEVRPHGGDASWRTCGEGADRVQERRRAHAFLRARPCGRRLRRCVRQHEDRARHHVYGQGHVRSEPREPGVRDADGRHGRPSRGRGRVRGEEDVLRQAPRRRRLVPDRGREGMGGPRGRQADRLRREGARVSPRQGPGGRSPSCRRRIDASLRERAGRPARATDDPGDMDPGRQLERHPDREPLHAGLPRLRLRRHGLRADCALLEVAEARRADREPRPGAFLQKMRGRWRRDEPLAQRRRLQLRSHARQQGVHNERRGMRGDRQAHLRHGGRVRRTLGRRRRRLEHAWCESPVRKSVRLCKRPRRLART